MAAATAPARRLAILGLLIAVSAIGSYVKLGPYSIAFDSAAGFLAALALGPVPGALVSGLGHLAVAGLTGFPLTPFFHLAVVAAMALTGALGGLAARRFGPVAGAVAMVLVNGLAGPWLLAFMPNPLGRGLFAALVLPLTLAAAANVAVALVALGGLNRSGVRL